MSDILTSAQRVALKAQMKNHFDTFKRQIYVIKGAVACPTYASGIIPAPVGCFLGPSGYVTGIPSGATFSQPSISTSYQPFYDTPPKQFVSVRPAYQGNNVNGTFQPLVSLFYATIIFEKPSEGDNRPDARIKVEKNARDFMMDAITYGKTDRIAIDGNSYEIVSEDFKKSFLDSDYFTIFLNSLHTNQNVNL